MTNIKLTGWQVGMRKISLTKLLQDKGGLSLANAKRVVDDILDGREVSLQLPAGEDANAVAAALRDLGAICDVQHDSP
jgi:ribosomal protein L7/L12